MAVNNNFSNKSLIIGSWIQIGDSEFTKMMIRADFDFLVMDMEHGSITENELPGLLQIFDGTNCIPIVRVANNDAILIRRALDLGAKGIIIPAVNSKEDVVKAENAIFYPKKGKRGIGYSRANNYGLDFNNYFKSSNDEIYFVVQIEDEIAIENINDIFSSNNIDAYIIGPYDLTGSMGIVGEFDNLKYLKNLEKIKASADIHGIKSGIHIVNPNVDELKIALKSGYKFVAYSTDALLLYDKCKKDLSELKT